MKRRSFLQVLGAIVVAAATPFKYALPAQPVPTVQAWTAFKFPPLDQQHDYVMLMSRAQLKAYRELGYDLKD